MLTPIAVAVRTQRGKRQVIYPTSTLTDYFLTLFLKIGGKYIYLFFLSALHGLGFVAIAVGLVPSELARVLDDKGTK